MTRTEREALKYAVVRNVTKNPKLAQKARGWSNERIFNELNIVIPKKEIKVTRKLETAEDVKQKYQIEGFVYKYREKGSKFVLKKPELVKLDKKKTEKFQRMQNNKLQYAVKNGLDVDEANNLKHKTYKQIDLAIKYNTKYRPTSKRADKKLKMDRTDDFRNWAKTESFPPNFVRQARLINLKKNLDINESYGFGVMYYAYINNRTPEHFEKQFEYNKATGSIVYPVTIKF